MSDHKNTVQRGGDSGNGSSNQNVSMSACNLLRAAMDDDDAKTMALAVKHGAFENLCDMVTDDDGVRKSVIQLCHEYALECASTLAAGDPNAICDVRTTGRLHDRTNVIVTQYAELYAIKHVSIAKDNAFSLEARIEAKEQMRTALHFAADFDHDEACRALCKLIGFDANAKDPVTGQTALHGAAYYGLLKTVKMLVSFGKTRFMVKDNDNLNPEQTADARIESLRNDATCSELRTRLEQVKRVLLKRRQCQIGKSKGLAKKRMHVREGRPLSTNPKTVAMRAYYRNRARRANNTNH